MLQHSSDSAPYVSVTKLIYHTVDFRKRQKCTDRAEIKDVTLWS